MRQEDKSCCLSAAEHLLAGVLMYVAGVAVFGWSPEVTALGAILIGYVKSRVAKDPSVDQLSSPEVGYFALLVAGVAAAAEIHSTGWFHLW